MIILDNPIKGFNNILTTATSDIIFGYNTNSNKIQRSERTKAKKQLQMDRPTEHLESLDKKVDEKTVGKGTPKKKDDLKTSQTIPRSNLTTIFLMSSVLPSVSQRS